MAYQIIEPLINPVDVRPLGIRLDVQSFTPLYLTTDQAYENLKTLLLTRKGERYHQPNFGTRLLNILFEPNDKVIAPALKHRAVIVDRIGMVERFQDRELTAIDGAAVGCDEVDQGLPVEQIL